MALNENILLLNNSSFNSLLTLSSSDIIFYDLHQSDLINTIKSTYNISANILLTNGSQDAIKLLLSILPSIYKSNQIITESPTYKFTTDCIADNKLIHHSFSFADNEINKHIIFNHFSGIVYICNPNNPTNTSYSIHELLSIISSTSHVCFIIDEAYIEFLDESLSMIPYVNTYPNLFVIRTFSKYYGLAGLRLGYVVSQLNLSSYYSNRQINNVSCLIANRCLKNKQIFIDMKTEYNKISKIIYDNLKSHYYFLNGFNKSNFLCIYTGSHKNTIIKSCNDSHISIKDLELHYNLNGYVRLGMTTNYIDVLNIFTLSTSFIPINFFYYSTSHHHALLSLFNTLSFIFSSLNLNICITDGTLLGYFRLNNIIKWDDDIDLCYFDDINIDSLLTECQKYNIRLRKNRTNAYWQFDIPVSDSLNSVHIDLFPYILDNNNNYVNNDERFRTNSPSNKECNLIYSSDILPYIPITFSYFNINTFITNNAYSSLLSSMGPDVISQIKIKYNNSILLY